MPTSGSKRPPAAASVACQSVATVGVDDQMRLPLETSIPNDEPARGSLGAGEYSASSTSDEDWRERVHKWPRSLPAVGSCVRDVRCQSGMFAALHGIEPIWHRESMTLRVVDLSEAARYSW